MINFLISVLGPIFYGMGVSEADFEQYLTSLSGYIYAILIALIVMIVVLIVAHKAKKGTRFFVRSTAVVAFLALVTVLVNVICYGPMYTNVSGFMNASTVELSDATVQNSKDTIKKVGEEGMVLVKNTELLPLSSDTTQLNVFGWASTNPLFGGTGSGSSDTSSNIGILQSLADAGYTTNEDLTKIYTDYTTERPAIGMQNQDWTLPEPTVDVYTDSVMDAAKEFSDTAVIVIGRSGGEGADLPTDMKAVIDGTWNNKEEVSVNPDNYGYRNGTYTNNGSYDDFEEGETYLELSVTEEQMVAKVCENFDKVIVVINANNPMELGWVEEYDQIGAVLLAPGEGSTGFSALGEIINGSVNPSGKTVDTYVRDLTATPTFNNFGQYTYDNTAELQEAIKESDAAYEGSMAFVNYVEGIYVGYKFYETAADEGFLTYEEHVQYPFGYGLSYTTFSEEIKNFSETADSITFDVEVTNTGDVAGKDVVEVYFTPPYTNGGIEKASVNLVQFEKTAELEAGASETVSFEIAKEELASYDSEGIKVEGGGYILEAGEYVISVREDSHTVVDSVTFNEGADIDYSTDGRASDGVVATNQFEDYSRGDFTQLSRADGFANYAEATAAPTNFTMSDEVMEAVRAESTAGYDPTLYDDASDEMPTLGADNGLTLYDLKGAAYDDEKWDQLLDQLTFEDMTTMVNIGGWQTAEIASVGKIATSDCDGPAGLNNFITGAYGTSYPAEVLMAQTWNKELLKELGTSMSAEYKEANNFGWYGPAMNTHRNAFAGRNFEYYSEDGVLAGYLAAAEINGSIENGVYPYIKHFALNDQETNRCSFLLTWASEQAIREIYLKPFELAVKSYEGEAMAVMSAFNFIGTVASCGNDALLNTVLRDEWGFVGLVETDYDGSYGYMITDKAVRNGNDLMLGFGFAASNQMTDQSATATLALRQACKNIMYVIVNSGYYAGDSDPFGAMDNMTKTFIKIDVIIGILLAALFACGLFVFAKNRKNNK